MLKWCENWQILRCNYTFCMNEVECGEFLKDEDSVQQNMNQFRFEGIGIFELKYDIEEPLSSYYCMIDNGKSNLKEYKWMIQFQLEQNTKQGLVIYNVDIYAKKLLYWEKGEVKDYIEMDLDWMKL